MYRDNTYTISISLNKKLDYSAPILFKPYGLSTAPYSAPSFAESFGGHGKATKDRQTSHKAIKVDTNIKPSSPLALPALRSLGEGGSAAKGGVSKGSPPKNPTTITSIATIKNKPTEIKKTEIATIEPKPTPIKKETAKLEPLKPAQTPIKKEATKLPFDTPPLAALPPSPRLRSAGRANGEGKEVTPIIPENAYVSDNYREVEALRRHAQLQNEIINCWKPPFGVSPDCACDISFSVSTTGAVHDVTITKSSGALMYDISARQALYAMTMPKWTYGKQLIINFKQ